MAVQCMQSLKQIGFRWLSSCEDWRNLQEAFCSGAETGLGPLLNRSNSSVMSQKLMLK